MAKAHTTPKKLQDAIDSLENAKLDVIHAQRRVVRAYQAMSAADQKRLQAPVSQYVWLPCNCYADDGNHKKGCPRWFQR